MGQSKISFGDKLFLCGQFLQYVEEFGEYEPNALVTDNNIFTDGYVVEILSATSLATLTPFNDMEMVDITGNLSVNPPLLSGTKIWMPTIPLHG
jgi:hypothetical protein